MIGTIIAAGFGTVAFRMGMDAQRMSSEGKSVGDIVCGMPKSAATAFTDVAGAVKNAVVWPFEKLFEKGEKK